MRHVARELLSRIASMFRRRERDEDFDAELAAHLEMSVQEHMSRGMSAEEAHRVALLELGGLSQTRELHRDSRGLPQLETLVRDIDYAARVLRRNPGLTLFAVLIIGLGVAAGSTVFSVFNTLFVRPLPFESPGRLVWIANGRSANLSSQTVQVANLQSLRAQTRSFVDVAGYSPFYGSGDIRLTGNGEPERLTGVPVTQRFFRLLGIRPHLGRFFSADEALWNAQKTVVLSHNFWRRRMAADPNIIGRSITLDGKPATVIGVLPASFDFASTFTPGARADLFTPYPLSPETDAHGNTLALIARLRDGVDIRTAQAETTVIAERIRSERKEGQRLNAFRPTLSTLRERITGKFYYASLALVGAVGFLMLLVCANLSNLLLVRASVRQKEMAIRAALGAGRGRLIRQLLAESLTLALCGAALGVTLAFSAINIVSRWEDTTIPLLRDVQLDATALVFTLLITLLTGVAFGLAPALGLSALAPHNALKEGSRGSTEGRAQGRLRRAFVVAEVGLVCVLLTGAGLLIRSLIHVLDVTLGFETENVIALRIDPAPQYATVSQKNAYYDEMLRAVRSVPGVEAAGLTDALPLGDNFGWRTWDARQKGHVNDRERAISPLVRMIDNAYLNTMKIPLLAGRAFQPADEHPEAEPVIIVNEALTRRLWPGRDPLGQVLVTSNQERRVVGVVGGVRYFGLEQDPGLEMYLPLRRGDDYQVVDLVVRGSIPVANLIPDVRAALRNADPNLPAANFRTMQQLVAHSVFPRRSVVMLLAGFALFGLTLASLGIYAVISYSVSLRKQEIGIRMALGASPRDLQTGILVQTLRLVMIGVAVGVPAAWVAAQALRGLLFGVPTSDPVTFAAVLAVMTAVAALAGYLPARRASRLNPLDALRAD